MTKQLKDGSKARIIAGVIVAVTPNCSRCRDLTCITGECWMIKKHLGRKA